ncbi:MAG: hypothetical protein ABIK23_07710 [candidate division WOR-3 bacterium]
MENQLPDEEKAQKILRAFRNIERREHLHRRSFNIIWLITLILLIAVFVIFFANYPKFKLMYKMLTQPDSLLVK